MRTRRNSWCRRNLTLAAAALFAALPVSAGAAGSDEILIFSFFRDNGQAGIYLAASEDGLTFTPLNNDQPVMKPPPWAGQNLTRDPSIVYHDGRFHAVWTSGWQGNCFGYAESKDLREWSEPVRVQSFPAAQKQPYNCWAPEICWDPVGRTFMIAWSSNGRLHVSRTADGKTFTNAKPFFDHPVCIDGMLVLDGDRWVMVYKNENEIAKGGKNLRLATVSKDFSGPWSWAMDSQPIVGPGSDLGAESMVEGASLLKRKDGWFLYYDSPLIKVYGMASSPDLKRWTDRTAELRLPANPRHGTVFRAPRKAVAWLTTTTPISAGNPLVPPGLAPGDRFRLVFVTSTKTTASSPNIGYYNSFVTERTLAVPALKNLGVRWNCIGSTATVSARSNTGMGEATPDRGVPIYRLDGKRVSDDYVHFWGGHGSDGNAAYLHAPIDLTELGKTLESHPELGNTPVFTGADMNGGISARPLGHGTASTHGWCRAVNAHWGQSGHAKTAETWPIYAMSDVLEVVADDTQ